MKMKYLMLACLALTALGSQAAPSYLQEVRIIEQLTKRLEAELNQQQKRQNSNGEELESKSVQEVNEAEKAEIQRKELTQKLQQEFQRQSMLDQKRAFLLEKRDEKVGMPLTYLSPLALKKKEMKANLVELEAKSVKEDVDFEEEISKVEHEELKRLQERLAQEVERRSEVAKKRAMIDDVLEEKLVPVKKQVKAELMEKRVQAEIAEEQAYRQSLMLEEKRQEMDRRAQHEMDRNQAYQQMAKRNDKEDKVADAAIEAIEREKGRIDSIVNQAETKETFRSLDESKRGMLEKIELQKKEQADAMQQRMQQLQNLEPVVELNKRMNEEEVLFQEIRELLEKTSN